MAQHILTSSAPEYEVLDRVRKYCITKSPGFAGVALLPRYEILDKADAAAKEIAYTDGNTIWVGPKFFKESPKAQAFILVHEVLHVALRHPQRGLALRKIRQANNLSWDDEIFNYAADAIVNFSMANIGVWLHKPSMGLVQFTDLLDAATLNARPPHRWNVESLCVHLLDNVCKGGGGGAGSVNPDAKQNLKNGLPNKGKDSCDVQVSGNPSAGKSEPRPDSREEARNWDGRVKRAAVGDRPGGIMKEILFDVPVTQTPWQHYLRKFITEAVMPITHVAPSRPSRQTLILDAAYKQDNRTENIPFFPAYRPKPGIRNLVIVVDTSGSIDNDMVEYFCAEIQTIRKKLGCDLTIITCDAEVHQTIKVQAHENLHAVVKQNKGFKGRGGTNFVPGVEAAEKVKGAAVIVYLTDMMGPYPKKCRLPLLWASTSDQYQKPPVGRVVVLKPKEY